MGKKIPGKKHNKIKDPEKQRLIRDAKSKDKINNPPEDPDFQHVPKSATRLAEAIEKTRSFVGIKKKKAKKVQPSAFFKSLGVKVTQDKQEPGNKFIYRVHKACEQVLKEAKFENKYRIKIQRNPETNEVEKLVKQKKLDAKMLLTKDDKKSNSKKEKKRKFNTENDDDDVGKSETKKNKKKVKQEEESFQEFTDKTDIVKFGDVVHAPPTLLVPHKIAKIKTSSNPGDRDLLLKTVMKQNLAKSKTESASQKQSKMDDKIKNSQVPDKKGKRKNLPTAIRQKLEAQQQEAIAAYKNLKKRKGSNYL